MSYLLVDRLWPRPEDLGARAVRAAALTILGAMLMATWSWVAFGEELPVTLQSLAVLAVALAYGPRIGPAAVALYLGAGLLGLPAYQGASQWGASFVLSPTFGTYVGYLLAAGLVGWLAEKGIARTWIGRLEALALGQALVYAVNVPWMAAYLTKGSGFPFSAMLGIAWREETLPFVYSDLAKVVAAAVIIWGIERALRLRTSDA